jgi:hypothetical protein
MKKDESFKFRLDQRVFIIGRPGICVVTGRGKMSFVSGGTANMYQLNGGQDVIVQEAIILEMAEAIDMNKLGMK